MNGINKYKPHYKSILKLGIPIIVGQIAVILLGFIDNMMVGQHNLLELSASSFVNNFQNIMLIFGLGFSYGLTPLVAESEKKNNLQNIGKLLQSSLQLNISIAFIISLLLIGLIPFLALFNLNEELKPLALPYYYLQTLSFIVSMIFNAYKQFYDGMSRTQFPMYVTIGGIGLNIFLNYLFIYGKWGMPEWGLWGAGIATLASRISMLSVIIFSFYKEKKWKQIHKNLLFFRTHISSLKKLFKMGYPIAIQLGLEAISFSIIIIFVAKLGAYSLAAHQVILVVTLLGYLVYYGLGAATAIRVSHFKALEKREEIQLITKASVHIGLILAIFSALLMFFIRNYVSFLFTPEEKVQSLVAVALIPIILYQIPDVLQVIFSNALRGLGTVKKLIPIAFICHIIVAPTLSYIFCFVFAQSFEAYQLMAIWSSFPISLGLTALLLFRYLKKSLHKPFDEIA